jgi:hypothetical protein
MIRTSPKAYGDDQWQTYRNGLGEAVRTALEGTGATIHSLAVQAAEEREAAGTSRL